MFEPVECGNILPALTKGTVKRTQHAMADSKVAIKTFEFKLRPNKHFVARCERTLEACRQLYNAALEERIDCYKTTGKSLDYVEQSRHLTDARREVEGVSDTYRDIQSDALDRVDKAYANFFRRVKAGSEKPGFPRFKSRDRYDSFGCARRERDPFPLKGDKLKFPGLGSCRLRLSLTPARWAVAATSE